MCRPRALCEEPSRQAAAWVEVGFVVLATAVVQLTLVSGVWLATASFPSVDFKCLMYFTQVGRARVRVACPSARTPAHHHTNHLS
jgi:hypothetical protein